MVVKVDYLRMPSSISGMLEVYNQKYHILTRLRICHAPLDDNYQKDLLSLEVLISLKEIRIN